MNNRGGKEEKQSNKTDENTTSKCRDKRKDMVVETAATEENVTEKLLKTGESCIGFSPPLLGRHNY